MARRKTKTVRTKRLAMARTQRELATAVGRDVAAINRWIHDDRWPFGLKAPWDVEQVKRWAAQTLAEQQGGGGRHDDPGRSLVRKADTALKAARLANLKHDLEEQKSEWHRADECEARITRQKAQVREIFLEMVESLPIERDQRAIVRGRILEILQVLKPNVFGPNPHPDPTSGNAPAKGTK